MGCNKFALLLVAMAVVLVAALPPTVTAARNEVMLPFSIIDIRNPFAGMFLVNKPAENCDPNGDFCGSDSQCCSGNCAETIIPGARGAMFVGNFLPIL
ncbi:hypothetical protein GQ457_01G044930 [Hibiscus cannabinus]